MYFTRINSITTGHAAIVAATLLISACSTKFVVQGQSFELEAQFVEMARSAEVEAKAAKSTDLCRFWQARTHWAAREKVKLQSRFPAFDEFWDWIDAKWQEACRPCGNYERRGRPRRDKFQCSSNEICSGPEGGICILRADVEAKCRSSEACRSNGQCVAAAGGCRAAQDSDCGPSVGCQEEGRCTAYEGRCIVAKDADCLGSKACKTTGNCGVTHFLYDDGQASPNRCLPMSPDHCRRSLGCRESGLCTQLDNQINCSPGRPDDCRNSTACKKEGKCFLKVKTELLEGETIVSTKCDDNSEEKLQQAAARAAAAEVEAAVTTCTRIAAKVRTMRPQTGWFGREDDDLQGEYSAALKVIDEYAGVLLQQQDKVRYQALVTRLKKCVTPKWFRTFSN